MSDNRGIKNRMKSYDSFDNNSYKIVDRRYFMNNDYDLEEYILNEVKKIENIRSTKKKKIIKIEYID